MKTETIKQLVGKEALGKVFVNTKTPNYLLFFKDDETKHWCRDYSRTSQLLIFDYKFSVSKHYYVAYNYIDNAIYGIYQEDLHKFYAEKKQN